MFIRKDSCITMVLHETARQTNVYSVQNTPAQLTGCSPEQQQPSFFLQIQRQHYINVKCVLHCDWPNLFTKKYMFGFRGHNFAKELIAVTHAKVNCSFKKDTDSRVCDYFAQCKSTSCEWQTGISSFSATCKNTCVIYIPTSSDIMKLQSFGVQSSVVCISFQIADQHMSNNL